MTKVISVNSGSSSLKFQLFDMPSHVVLASGQAERIGQEMGIFTIKFADQKDSLKVALPNHKIAVDILLKALVDKKIVENLLSRNEGFNTQQIADDLDISRITIRKYLNYMVNMNVLSEDAEYSTSGRPVSIYSIVSKEELKKLL